MTDSSKVFDRITLLAAAIGALVAVAILILLFRGHQPSALPPDAPVIVEAE